MRHPAKPCAIACVLASALASAARLPDDVKPRSYRIELDVDLDAGTFAGEETIDVEVARKAARIVLHSVGLQILDARAGAPGREGEASAIADEKTETIALTPARGLSAGAARVKLRFRGKLDDKLRGLYLARSEGRRFAVTQFEGTDARRAFPCFDEPAMKARFQLTVTVPHGMAAISNTPIATRTAQDGARRDRVEFGETLPMSSYLVALAVGPFASIRATAGKTPVTVWAPSGKERLADYALREAVAILPRLESWFGIAYPYGKLDLIAAPEFQFGAMENVAAIVFKSSALLLDDKVASPAARRRVTEVIAHEIAHQWFGDLVTMAWWDDIWLNESFATWMEKKVVSELHPEWKIWRDFSVERDGPLAVDELADAHPIRAPMFTAAEEPESSPTIIYGKGAATLRMIETWLGEERFRGGVQRYLTDHRFGNTRAADFFAALGGASGQPVGQMAERWISQAGHPLVKVSAACMSGATRVTFEQERLFGDGAGRDQTLWPVPVCLRLPTAAADPKGHETCVMLQDRRQSIDVPMASGGCAPWVVANAGAAGFFRVLYDDASLAALLKVAPRLLVPAERVALLDDQWALVAAGKAPMSAWLDVLHALTDGGGEHDRAVLAEIAAELSAIDRNLVADGQRAGFAALVQSIFGPRLVELGMTPRPGDDEDARRTRAIAIEAMGRLARRPEVIAAARSAIAAFARDPGSLDGSLADAWVAVAAASGDTALFEQYLGRVKADRTPEERDRFLDGLARFDRAELVERALALSLSDTLRTEEIDRPIRVALQARAGRGAALRFLTAHVDELARRASPYGMIRLINSTDSLCGDDESRRVAELFAAHPVPRGKLALALAAGAIRVCGALRDRGMGALAATLGSATRKM